MADGYGNHRVIVFDADTGKYKRHWGAYGNKPDDTNLGNYNPDDPPAQQFRNPVHCAELSNDGLLYVCDRVNDRIQVFKPDGTFIKEVFIAKNTLGDGSVWDIAFLERSAAEIHLSGRRRERKSVRDAARFTGDPDQLRRWRTPAGPVLRSAQHRHGFERQHLHHRNLSRPARAAFNYKGIAAGYEEGSGSGLAREEVR